MIQLIEVLNFRCLRYIRQPLGRFHVLVGPNATGKTTFLDVVAFLGRLVSDGPEAAIRERTQNFQDLAWGRSGRRLELAIEVTIPEDRRHQLPRNFDTIRYEVAIGLDPQTDEIGILEENAMLKNGTELLPPDRTLFPMEVEHPDTIMVPKRKRGIRRVLTKFSRNLARDGSRPSNSGRASRRWVTCLKMNHAFPSRPG